MKATWNMAVAFSCGFVFHFGAAAATPGEAGGGRERPFDAGWRFLRGDAAGAEAPGFDDAGWRVLDLPHDFSIEDLPQKKDDSLPVVTVTRGRWRFSRGDDPSWKEPGFDDAGWQEVSLPAYWNDHSGYAEVPSIGWYRRRVDIPREAVGREFLLNVGIVDDADETFFNGQRVGGLGGFPPAHDPSGEPWKKPRVYRVAAALSREEDNVVAVRVYNHSGKGGLYAAAEAFRPVGPFSPESAGGADTGHVVGGIGWYRKRFTLEAADGGRKVSVVFDGAYMDSDAWLNGHHLGNHPYGYTAFAFDLTPHLEAPGKENVLSVRVRNLGRNSRWYSGSGLYRHARLTVTDPVRVPLWGLAVTTPQVSREAATVEVAATVEDGRNEEVEVTVRARIVDPEGRPAGTSEARGRVAAGGRSELKRSIALTAPALWSTRAPALYRAEVEVEAGGTMVDRTSTAFGVRSIRFDPKEGFLLNGEPMKLRGACVHHDNGPLGAAAIDRAEERRVELLLASGFSAVRTSHNPPSTAFLDACDRRGMLVMDEAFDMWEEAKKPDDYHRFFGEWWERDLTAMVLRDRNHPSVILWSIGNEIPERGDPKGLEIGARLAGTVRRLDPTRPVTAAICEFWDRPGKPWSYGAPAFALLDVGGYNYQWKQYEPDRQQFPDRIMAGTESFPGQAFESWRAVEKSRWVIGDFVWTGIDYIGESGIGHVLPEGEANDFLMPWPWHVSYCGDLDMCGFKKPQSRYRDVLWRRSPVEIAVHRPLPAGKKEKVSGWGWPDEEPSWTWPDQDGKPLQVAVYSSAPAVRMSLNGKAIGEKPIPPEARLTARFEVPYAPGVLRAVGIDGGKETGAAELRTAGDPARLRLTADRPEIRADRSDLSYVTVEVVDEAGIVVPHAAATVWFRVEGVGELAGVGNGNPADAASFKAPRRRPFRGRCLAIVRPTGPAGEITLRAEADGVDPGEVKIRTK